MTKTACVRAARAFACNGRKWGLVGDMADESLTNGLPDDDLELMSLIIVPPVGELLRTDIVSS
jgi:hypothetical protein